MCDSDISDLSTESSLFDEEEEFLKQAEYFMAAREAFEREEQEEEARIDAIIHRGNQIMYACSMSITQAMLIWYGTHWIELLSNYYPYRQVIYLYLTVVKSVEMGSHWVSGQSYDQLNFEIDPVRSRALEYNFGLLEKFDYLCIIIYTMLLYKICDSLLPRNEEVVKSVNLGQTIGRAVDFNYQLICRYANGKWNTDEN